MEVLKYQSFDGILYYSWNPSSYMGDTIEDVFDEEEYKKAFKDVLDAAKKNSD